jgi:hypothetical protein
MFEASWKEISDENYAVVRQHFPELPEVNPHDYVYAGGDTIMSAEDAVDLMALTGVKIEIKPHKGCRNFPGGITGRLEKLETEGHLMRQKMKTGDWGVQIHVPNFWLCAVNDVCVKEDYCTDMLNEDLKAGWRILAICPPLDERRPTYILGRVLPEKE